jgi:hypothetical protein
MNYISIFAKPVSVMGLLVVVVAPILFFAGTIQSGFMNGLLIGGTIAWFASAPWWVKSE